MRLLGFLAVLAAFVFTVAPLMAADEFGSRFAADAPSALQDDPEKALADIMPAAGDEEDDDAADEEDDESEGNQDD